MCATTRLLAERFLAWKATPADDRVLATAKTLYAKSRAEAAGYGEWSCWSNDGQRPKNPAADSIPHVLDGRTIHFMFEGASRSWRDASMDPPQRAALGAADGRLLAPMNGKVVEVHANAGDSVAAGSALIVLEAMKMEHTLSAPAALRVTTVHATRGAQVSPGQLLMEFESA